MAIARWEPFQDALTAQDRFNRLFSFLGSEPSGQSWMPAVDIVEKDDRLMLKAELPGINPDDVEIRVEGNTLYLKGQRKFEKEVKEENFHRIERSYGTFSRTFALPSSVDPDRVSADYKDGILTLTMPKREEAKPKTIKINAAKSQAHSASGSAKS